MPGSHFSPVNGRSSLEAGLGDRPQIARTSFDAHDRGIGPHPSYTPGNSVPAESSAKRSRKICLRERPILQQFLYTLEYERWL